MLEALRVLEYCRRSFQAIAFTQCVVVEKSNTPLHAVAEKQTDKWGDNSPFCPSVVTAALA